MCIARWFSLLLLVVATSGCSLRTLAVNQIGDALARGGTTFSADDDPELVGAALPFSLKLMESLLAESPHHKALLTAAARGFTQYSYGWVAPEDMSAPDAAERAERAKRLYLRARDYGMRALAESVDNFHVRMSSNPSLAVRHARKRDVEALYWTATAWGLAISSAKDDLKLLGDLHAVEALIIRAAELDPDFGDGAIDTFLLTYEGSRSGISKEAEAHARKHFQRATERTHGQSAAPYVAAAETFAIPAQDRAEFELLLAAALSVDPNTRPEWRLQNILARRRAEWLLAHADDFFIDGAAKEGDQ